MRTEVERKHTSGSYLQPARQIKAVRSGSTNTVNHVFFKPAVRRVNVSGLEMFTVKIRLVPPAVSLYDMCKYV